MTVPISCEQIDTLELFVMVSCQVFPCDEHMAPDLHPTGFFADFRLEVRAGGASRVYTYLGFRCAFSHA